MTNQEKTSLVKLISNGNIQDVIERLLSANLSENKRKEALAIASQFKRLKSQKIKETLSFEQTGTTENQVVDHLIELINFPDNQTYPAEKSIDASSTAYPEKEKKPLGYKIGIIGSMASIIGLLLYFLPLWNEQAPQLTVYVTDTNGNVALEHDGKLNTSIGNRPMRETIGEHGRTNFGDILPENLGDSIIIGFQAEGWELVAPNNTFVFDGKPIYLQIGQTHQN